MGTPHFNDHAALLFRAYRARQDAAWCTTTDKKTVGGGTCFPPYTILLVCSGQLYKNQRRRLKRRINFAVRIVTGLGNRASVSGVLRELGWRAVEDTIVERDLCTMYKLIHDVGAPELLRSRIVSRSDVSVRTAQYQVN